MARIRTIKPDFFTSADVVGLSPLARLLYISTWCEADKEGRLEWKPMTFKLRYFPGDNCDINALCNELIESKLIVLYGDGLAYIPTFRKHQHINPRESESSLPDPDAKASKKHARPRVTDASARVDDAQGGREGKGREYKNPPNPPGGDGFDRFWSEWPNGPRKVAKAQCAAKWERHDLEAEADAIVAAVVAFKASAEWAKDNGAFIPMPATWLNKRRWEAPSKPIESTSPAAELWKPPPDLTPEEKAKAAEARRAAMSALKVVA